jgi:hypothetical protein
MDGWEWCCIQTIPGRREAMGVLPVWLSRNRMFRNLYRWLKQIITVLIVLVVLVCFVEVSLRVYDSHTGQVTRCEMFDLGLTAKSRACHHELKPLLKYSIPAKADRPPFDVETNSLGLRGAEVIVPKAVGTYRIFCRRNPQSRSKCSMQELLNTAPS